MSRLAQILGQLSPVEQPHIARLLVKKVLVSPRDIEVRLWQTGIEDLGLELRLGREVAA